MNIVFYLTLLGRSHLDFVSSLIEVLVERGHTVDLVLGRVNPDIEWKGVTKAHNVVEFGFPAKKGSWSTAAHLVDPFGTKHVFMSATDYYGFTTRLCQIGLESNTSLEFLTSKKYDAAIVSDYDYCGFILAHAAGIQTMMSYSAMNLMHHHALHIGLPSPASLSMGNVDQYEGQTTFKARLMRLYHLFTATFFEWPMGIKMQTELARKYYGQDFPRVDLLAKNVEALFINTNEMIEEPRPLSHKVKYIGGIGLKQAKKLSEDFDKILSIPSKGTILVSFGSQVSPDRFNSRVKNAFLAVFRELCDYTFIFKYTEQPGEAALFSKLKNVHLVKWMPQTEILHDNRVVAFVTHAGLNSLLEASYAGVPMVAIPLFADQSHNARCVERAGIGLQLDKLTLSGDILLDALKTVLTDENIRTNSHFVSRLLVNHPNPPKQIFAEWVEYAATQKDLHTVLNLPEVEMDAISYYCIDLFVITAATALAIIYLLKVLFRHITAIVHTEKMKNE